MYLDSKGSRDVEAVFVGPYAYAVNASSSTVVYAIKEYLDRYGIDVDVVVRVWKGIPVSAGLGGSAASSVAALVALVRALDRKIDPIEVAEICGRAEIASAGTPHYDNAVASTFGYFVFLLSINPLRVYRFDIEDIEFVIATPKIENVIHRKTAIMRSVLPKSIDLGIHVRNSSSLAALLIGLINRDREILKLGFGKSFVDEARSRYVPCYYEVAEALYKLGYSISISGAGPSIMTFCFNHQECTYLAKLIKDIYERECDLDVCVRIASPAPGAVEVVNSYAKARLYLYS